VRPQPGRVRRPSTGRIVSWITLALVGCIASATVVFGDLISRGVALAALVAAAALAWVIAWRENRDANRARLSAALGEAMQQSERLSVERARQRAVVAVLSGRIDSLGERLNEANLRACTLQQQVSTLRGNHEALRVELELQALLNAPAEVLELAHRAELFDPWVTARELWRISDDQPVKRPA